MFTVSECTKLGNGCSDINISNYDVELCVLDGKLNIEDILSLNNISMIKEFFESIGLENYYDFYFLQLKDFKEVLDNNVNIKDLFKKVIGKENFTNSYIGNKQLLMFAERIGYKKLTISELKENILEDLKGEGITSLNEFEVFGVNNFKNVFNLNSYIKYFIYRKVEKSFQNIKGNDYEKIGESLGLNRLNSDEVKSELKNRFKLIGIIDLDDLVKIPVRNFWKMVENGLLLKSYFLSNGMSKSDIQHDDIENFGKDIGLVYKERNDLELAKEFLKNEGIFSYSDIIDSGIKYFKPILWKDISCRNILKSIGLIYLSDFRSEHMEKFARRVGLKGVPTNKEVTDIEVIGKIINLLTINGIKGTYSLKLKGIKYLKSIFKESTIGKTVNSEISSFLKKNDLPILSQLNTPDLGKLSELIGLSTNDEVYHKQEFLNFLISEGVNINKFSKSKVKNKYWHNIHIRYFLERQGIVDVKKLRPEHINKMKIDIENIG